MIPLGGQRRRGLTLMETLIATGISSVVAMGAITAMIFVQKGVIQSFWLNESSRESRFISDLVARDIRGAIRLESVFTSPGGTTFTGATDTLILRIPAIDGSENIVDIENNFDRIVYRPQSANSPVILREVFPDPASSRAATSQIIGNIVPEQRYNGAFLAYQNALGTYVVHYQFTASQTIAGKTYQTPISGSVRLRNKVMDDF